MNVRDIALAAVGKGSKNKTAKKNMYRLGPIKDWSGISNREGNINSLKGNLELADALNEAKRMDQHQKI